MSDTTQQHLRRDVSSISALVGDALSQFTRLFQSELDLAKAELSEKAQQVGTASGFIAVGAMLVIPAIVMALLALATLLMSYGWSEPTSYLVAAVIAAVLAAVAFAIGIPRLNRRHLAPSETMRQLEKDKDVVRGMAR
jgi:uncharacterized membrane protein YqjE